MQTNEELAMKIQQGERDKLPELWTQVERFVGYVARRRLQHLPEGTGLEYDDLYNAGYIAFVDAVNRFDPERDASLLTILKLSLKTAFAEAAGYRSQKQRKDPLHRAGSIYDLIPGTEDLRVVDSIPDESAAEAFEEAEHREYLEQLHGELENALSRIPEPQEGIIRRRFYDGDTLHTIGQDIGLSPARVRQIEHDGFRSLRNPRIGKGLLELLYPGEERRLNQRTNFYFQVGPERFTNTGTSAVEEIVFWREERRREKIERAVDSLLA